MAFTQTAERVYWTANRLKATEVKHAALGRRFYDGNGLWLRRTSLGFRWTYRFQWAGQTKEMSLPRDLSLAEARQAVADARAKVAAGIDPRPDKEAPRRLVQAVAQARIEADQLTFAAFAEQQVCLMEKRWRAPKTAQKWRRLLGKAKALPAVDKIEINDVVRVLKPIWDDNPKIGEQTRMHVAAILDAAFALGIRKTPNAAAWSVLKHVFASPEPFEHFASLPWQDCPTFYHNLGSDRLAGYVKFCILTAARPGEAATMLWQHIDLTNRLWVIPRVRTKKGTREHRTPLSEPAMAILTALPSRTGLVFPSEKAKPWAAKTALTRIRDVDPGEANDLTLHGFRATFRVWGQEHEPAFDRDLLEMCLGHAVANATEASYARSDVIAKRRTIMDQWASYVCPTKPMIRRRPITG